MEGQRHNNPLTRVAFVYNDNTQQNEMSVIITMQYTYAREKNLDKTGQTEDHITLICLPQGHYRYTEKQCTTRGALGVFHTRL